MKKIFVYYDDDHCDYEGVGFAFFDTLSQAEDFIMNRLLLDNERTLNNSVYRVIEGTELNIEIIETQISKIQLSKP